MFPSSVILSVLLRLVTLLSDMCFLYISYRKFQLKMYKLNHTRFEPHL